MVSGYVSNGRLEEGRALFDVMPVKNDLTWAIMIEGYFQYGVVSEAKKLFEEASKKSVFLCNAMLAGYSEMGCIDDSYDLFMRMCKHDLASCTNMITCFFRVGDIEGARKLFEEMPEKDVVAWTAMIRGYLNYNKIELARELFNKIPDKDIIAWNSMLVGYIENGKLREALDLFVRMPWRDIVSWNSILFGYVQQEDMTTARNFFEEMPRKDETSWNTLISGYLGEEALILYIQMLRNGFKPNQVTLTTLICVCGVHAIQVFGRGMHDFVIKSGYEIDRMITSSLISMYSKCGFINEAYSVFENMKNRDTVTWNAVIVAQAYHTSAREAFNLFSTMIQAGSKPDHVTFLVLLTACAHSGLVTEGWEYFSLMEQWNLIPKPEHYATMVDLLGRSGLLAEAFELAKKLPVDLPAYAWETLLSACRVHGNFELSNFIARKLLSSQPSNVGMHVLQSNIYSVHGMWKDAARVRALLNEQQLKKELGCSWIEINGRLSCFSYNDKSHTQSENIYKELEGLSVLVEEIGAQMH
ncbi:Pentatricopeptide repeat-containing protein [Abeliophyllum distichum]|uniref:Pentatricopeptide repeat-containing protein n=1 Tax=Abeliophyllum distichum TaxID=126358 RepID=A0ABD1TFS6_9LAMI